MPNCYDLFLPAFTVSVIAIGRELILFAFQVTQRHIVEHECRWLTIPLEIRLV